MTGQPIYGYPVEFGIYCDGRRGRHGRPREPHERVDFPPFRVSRGLVGDGQRATESYVVDDEVLIGERLVDEQELSDWQRSVDLNPESAPGRHARPRFVYRCECGLEVERSGEKLYAFASRLLDAGVSEVSLRDLARYAK